MEFIVAKLKFHTRFTYIASSCLWCTLQSSLSNCNVSVSSHFEEEKQMNLEIY